MNVRRTIPSHSLSIAVASGDSMADVDFGFVHDFGANEEFSAVRGDGARINGARIEPRDGDMPLEVVGVESADPRWILGAVEELQGKAYRLRAIGSIAITLSYVACGRFDGMFSARGCRSVDAAAAQLIVREVGGEMVFVGHELSEAPLDLDARYAVAAARSPEHLAGDPDRSGRRRGPRRRAGVSDLVDWDLARRIAGVGIGDGPAAMPGRRRSRLRRDALGGGGPRPTPG